MIAEVRYQMIMDILQRQGSASAQELSDSLHASISTIRRDLIALSSQGLLNKVHGGATLRDRRGPGSGSDVLTRQPAASRSEEAIARLAASLICRDDFVFVDGCPCTLGLIPALSGEALEASYVTNGLRHALALLQRGCTVSVLGGPIRPQGEVVLGSAALSSLGQYSFTKAFLGADGADPQRGFTAEDFEARDLKAAALKAARETWFLADSEKLGRLHPAVICAADAAGLITDAIPAPAWHAGPTVLVPNA